MRSTELKATSVNCVQAWVSSFKVAPVAQTDRGAVQKRPEDTAFSILDPSRFVWWLEQRSDLAASLKC